jgi:hypothetical protein
LVTCPTLIACSRDSDNVEREIETIAARYPVTIRDHDEFPNLIVYSSSDETLRFEMLMALLMFPCACAARTREGGMKIDSGARSY